MRAVLPSVRWSRCISFGCAALGGRAAFLLLSADDGVVLGLKALPGALQEALALPHPHSCLKSPPLCFCRETETPPNAPESPRPCPPSLPYFMPSHVSLL